MTKLYPSLLAMILFSMMISLVFAQNHVPQLINYQGFLTDENGTALTGNYQITFRLYDEASGNRAWLWHETHPSVTVENGLFNILLGSIETLTAEDLAGERYLALKFENEEEMPQRMQLASVAYSLNSEKANDADKLDQMDSKDFVAAGGDSITGDLVISGTLKVTEKIEFPEFFGWTWHDTTITIINNATTTADLVIDGPGILLMIHAEGGYGVAQNKIDITIDEKLWRSYTGNPEGAGVHYGSNNWNFYELEDDENAQFLTIMPFKAFTSKMKITMYNHTYNSSSSIRINYLTP